MPQANVTYDVPYNKNLASLISEMDEKHWQKSYPAYHPDPMGYRSSAYHGEHKMVGGGSSPLKYTPAGNSSAYPPLHLSSGLAVSSGGSSSKIGIDGAIGHPALHGGYSIQDFGRDLGSVAKEVAPIALPMLMGLGKRKKGGVKLGTPANMATDFGTAWKALQKSGAVRQMAEKVGLGHKKRYTKAEKHAMLKVGGYSFSDFLSNAGDVLAPAAKEIAPIAIKALLGAGKKRRAPKKGGFGLSDLLDVVKPIGKDLARKAIPKIADFAKDKALEYLGKGKKKGGAASGGRAKRAEIVKKVMREKGMKMIEASAFVKAHGLY